MKMVVDDSVIAYGNPAAYAGFTVARHDYKTVNTYDIFDRVKPDIYIGDITKTSKQVLKVIEERPDLKVIFLEPIESDNIDSYKKVITERFGNAYPIIKDRPKADLLLYYKPENIKAFFADVVSLDDNPKQTIFNIQLPANYIFRIFSSNLVIHNNYCGLVHDHQKKNIYKSSKFSISYGDNFYNSALCDCYPINPSCSQDVLDVINKNTNKELKAIKEEIEVKSNNFIALSEVLNVLNLDVESKVIISKMKEIL
jgi:hypothetical protein